MTSLRIALVQMQVDLSQPENNFTTARSKIRQAANQGAEMVLLPELWTSGYDLEHAAEYAKDYPDVLAMLSTLAAEHQVWIGGSTITQQKNIFFNTFALVPPTGNPAITYAKTHLFRLLNEEKIFSPGDNPTLASTPWGQLGMAICYDLRFPELLRCYGRSGSPLTLVVAEWGATRREHWRVLLRARAIENQMFIAAVNTCGQIGEVEYAGHSAVIDPWGDVLAEAGDDEAVLIVDIDFYRIDAAHRRLSSWDNDRPDLYQKWIEQRRRD